MMLPVFSRPIPAGKRLAFAIFLGLGLAARAEAPRPDTVMTVAGEPVSREEFTWFMQQELAGVAARYPDLPPAAGAGSWQHRAAGLPTLRQRWLQQTIDRIRREKAEQILFQKLGLVDDIRFAALLARWQQFNRDRATAQAQGRVIYGPEQFTLPQFYDHQRAELQIQAKRNLGEGRLAPPPEALEKYYRKHAQQFTTPELFTIEIGPAQAAPNSPTRYEGLSPERLAELFPNPRTLARVEKLKPGERLLPGDGRTETITCLAKTPERLRPFAEVKMVVRARCLDEAYTRHVDQLAHDAAVHIDRAALDALTVN
jgi:hypothetical protein